MCAILINNTKKYISLRYILKKKINSNNREPLLRSVAKTSKMCASTVMLATVTRTGCNVSSNGSVFLEARLKKLRYEAHKKAL